MRRRCPDGIHHIIICVHYVGPVPPEVVPQHLAQMDVCLTPYVNSQFNRASFPLKTMEYLGAGIESAKPDGSIEKGCHGLQLPRA